MKQRGRVRAPNSRIGGETWEATLALCCVRPPTSATQLAHCAWTLAKWQRHGRNANIECVQRLFRECWNRQFHAQFTHHELQCTLWAVGMLPHPDKSVLNLLVRESFQRLLPDGCKSPAVLPFSVGNMFWVMAKSDAFEEHVAAHMLQQARRLLPVLSPRDLAGISWACAFTLYDDSPILAAISKTCDACKFFGFSSQQLANLAWAFARVLGQSHDRSGISPEFWAAIVTNIGEFKPQEFSITLWAVAKLRLPGNASMHDLNLVEQVGTEMMQQNKFGPQELSNLACGVARLFVSHTKPVDRSLSLLTSIATSRMSELKSQHVANIMWSLGHTRCLQEGFVHATMEILEFQLASYATLELVGLMWSFARLSTHVAVQLRNRDGFGSGHVRSIRICQGQLSHVPIKVRGLRVRGFRSCVQLSTPGGGGGRSRSPPSLFWTVGLVVKLLLGFFFVWVCLGRPHKASFLGSVPKAGAPSPAFSVSESGVVHSSTTSCSIS